MTFCRLCENELIFKRKLTKELGNKEKIYLCTKCDTYFINPKPFCYDNSDDSLIDYYRERELWIKNRMDKIFLNFTTINSNGKTILDIGSGMGYAGVIAEQYGLEYTGIEPNITLFENAKNDLKINCINDYFPSTEVTKKFDFIILDNVLEHIEKPKEFFNLIISYLNPNGVLFLACPPTDWLRVLLSTNKLLHKSSVSRSFTIFDDLEQHINYFSDSSFKYLISSHKELKIISQFHHKEWSVPLHKLLNLTTGQYFIQNHKSIKNIK